MVDTLRQDHLGCYGWHRDTSPSLDALAVDSVRFTRAYAPAPWTLPSAASVVTGLYPSSHGATKLRSRLPTQVTTLAELMKEEGYATAGVVSHTIVSSRWNFHQGFDVFLESEARGHEHVSTDGVTRQAQAVLREVSRREEPFFLLVHYFDPHYDYIRHPEYGFAAPAAGRLDGTQTIQELRELTDMTPEEVGLVMDLYDEEIRHTDGGIGRLISSLRELGLYDDTVIVFTADHGEEFMGHGWIGHTRTLYDELVKVPLLIRSPRLAGAAGTVTEPVSLVSLTPTILDLAGIDVEKPWFQADSLVPLMLAGAGEGEGVVFAEVDFVPLKRAYDYKTTHKKAVATRDYKLIRDDETGRIELYNLRNDPMEQQDLSLVSPDLVEEIIPMLEAGIARSRGEEPGSEELDLTPEEMDRLKSLGYAGG